MARVFTLFLCAFAIPVWAGEYAIFSNGFRLRVERHEQAGDRIRLIQTEGYTELPANQVTGFEPEEYTPPPPAPPPPPPKEAQAPPAPPADARQLLDRAAARYDIPRAFLHSVAKAESGYRTDAVSPKGAIGVMQLMPGTAAAMSADPRDPEQNIEAGTRYLRDLLLKYKDYNDQVSRALAAYNAGPAAVDRHNGVPPYAETQNYVRKVISDYQRSTKQ
jgi:soluble lytic murein transglycosylase-like protein